MAKEERTSLKNETQKSLRQVVVALFNYSETKSQTVIFMFVTRILFGVKSILPQRLKSLYKAILKYASELRHKIKAGSLLGTNKDPFCSRPGNSTLFKGEQILKNERGGR